MFRKILAAVDNSARAPSVARTAIEVAERFDGTVHLYRVLTIPPEFPAAARNPPDHFEEVLQSHAHADLASLSASNPRVIVEPPVVGTREPWRAILDEAKRLSADLIVIGSHGYGGWDRLLGTVAGKVANHADRAVLIVHQPELERH